MSEKVKEGALYAKDKKRLNEANEFVNSNLAGFSSGYPHVDWVGGDEGILFPRGSIVEVAGMQQAGKTTLLLETIAFNQKLFEAEGKTFKVLWVDYEHSLETQFKLASNLGVKINKHTFRYIQPLTLEAGGQFIIEACRPNTRVRKDFEPDLIVVDTMAAARPSVEYDRKLGQNKQPGVRGKLWSEFFRNVVPELGSDGPCLVVINQLYKQLDIEGGPPKAELEYDSPGSNSLKYYADGRFFLTKKRGGLITKTVENPFTYEEQKTPIAQDVRIRGEKSKFGSPYREATLRNYFGTGFSIANLLVEVAERKQEKTGEQLIKTIGNNLGFAVLEKPGDVSDSNIVWKQDRKKYGSGPLGFELGLKENHEAMQFLASNLNRMMEAEVQSFLYHPKHEEIVGTQGVEKTSIVEQDLEYIRESATDKANKEADKNNLKGQKRIDFVDKFIEDTIKAATTKPEKADQAEEENLSGKL